MSISICKTLRTAPDIYNSHSSSARCRYYLLYLTGEETDSERLSNLSQVTQLLSGREKLNPCLFDSKISIFTYSTVLPPRVVCLVS